MNWFDDEVKERVGIDFRSEPFDFDKKYFIYRHKNIRLLVLRIEEFNEVFLQTVNDFLDTTADMIISENMASRKYYSDFYEEFLSQVIVDPDYLESIYNNSFVGHFYSEGEIASMKDFWNPERRKT